MVRWTGEKGFCWEDKTSNDWPLGPTRPQKDSAFVRERRRRRREAHHISFALPSDCKFSGSDSDDGNVVSVVRGTNRFLFACLSQQRSGARAGPS